MSEGLEHLKASMTALPVAAVAAAGCSTRAQSGPTPAQPPQVRVVLAEERNLVSEAQFTGRIDAVDRVDLRARVSGALDTVLFREGARVRAGAPLFKLDPRPFDIAVSRAAGELAAATAQLRRAHAELERAERLIKDDAISAEELARRRSEVEALTARVEATKAAHADALLNLEFSTVTAPVNGIVGRAEVTPGNLIVGGPVDGTRLTRIHSVDPVYVYFDLDPATADAAGATDRQTWRAAVISFGGAAHREGRIDFVDNGVSAQSGTLKVRARIPNPDAKLLPDAVVKVAFRYGPAQRHTVVPDVAISTDQGNRILMLVNDDGELEQRPITPGAKHGAWRVVPTASVRLGQPVVLQGRPGLRPGMKVEVVQEVLR